MQSCDFFATSERVYAREFRAARAKTYTHAHQMIQSRQMFWTDVGVPEGGSAGKTGRLATPAVCCSLE